MAKTRRILLSDFHETPFREVKFESQKLSLGERIIQFLSGEKKKKRVFKKAREYIRTYDIPFFISNGDLMEARSTEQGWAGDADRNVAIGVRREIEEYLGKKGVFGIGNHETGYRLPLTTDPEAGISRKSIENTLLVYGRESLYHSFVHEGIRFIFLPYLFMEEAAVDFDIERLKNDLLDSFHDDLEESEVVILFLHDPESLCYGPLNRLMQSNKKKIKAVFCGHFHARQVADIFSVLVRIYNSFFFAWLAGIIFFLTWLAFDSEIARKIYHYFVERRELPELMKRFQVEIIPAPGGMMGVGGGFLVLNLLEDGTSSIEKYQS